MELKLIISENGLIKIKLLRHNEIIDKIVWKDKNNLSKNLLKKIDVLLRKNKVSLDRIYGYKIISDIEESWTTYRIAKITMESLMVGKDTGLAKNISS